MTALAAEKEPSSALAAVAAFAPLLGLPVLLAFATVVAGGPEAFTEVWYAGGYGMYGVVVGGGIAALAAVPLLFHGVRRGGGAALALLPVGLLPLALGVLGMQDGVIGSSRAVVHAAPIDRAVIMWASVGEASQCLIFGFAATGALFLTGAAGAGLGAVAAAPGARRVLLGTAASAAVFGVLAWVHAAHTAAGAKILVALAHVAPADYFALLSGSELAGWRPVELGVLAVAVVVVAAGVAAVRATSNHLVGLAALGLVTLVGLSGPARMQSWAWGVAARVGASPASKLELLDVPGYAPQAEPTLYITGKDIFAAEPPLDEFPEEPRREAGPIELNSYKLEHSLQSYARYPKGGGMALFVTLAADADAGAVDRLLRAALQQGLGTGYLFGGVDRPVPENVGELRPLFESARRSMKYVVVQLASQEKACETPCDFATVDETGLTVDGQHWPMQELPPAAVDSADEEPPTLALRASPTLSPKTLVRAAATASAHGRRLLLVYE